MKIRARCALLPCLLVALARTVVADAPPQGPIDSGFNPIPGTDDTVNVVLAQTDGKLIAGGRFTTANGIPRNRIARFNADGSVDGSFHPGAGPNGDIFAAVLQPDGRIIVAGNFSSFDGFIRQSICRLNTDGTVDLTFSPGSGFNNSVFALALQSDGRILAGGKFSSASGLLRFNLARLNPDGSGDASFDPINGPNGEVDAIAIQADGRIVIGGNFIGYNGFPRGGVARIFQDGSLDFTFDPGIGTGGNVFALALQHDGHVIIGGRFAQFFGINRTFIARLFNDGSLDPGFVPVPNDWVQSLAAQADDRVLVGGFFTTMNGFVRNRFARLNADGSLDLTFDPGGGFQGTLSNDAPQVRSIAISVSDRIFCGGSFTSYNGFNRANVVRLLGGAAMAQNLSTRADVLTGERVLIGGFIIIGAQNKTVLIRGMGPSLAPFGISGFLADPMLTLHDESGATIASNDNWKLTQQAQIQATGLAPGSDAEAAILISLAPGRYTAVLEGVGSTTGIGLVEIYDLDPNVNAGPINLSTRGFVGTGDSVMIGGTIVRGSIGSAQRVLIRALGPSLVPLGVANPLPDTVLSLRDANGNEIGFNDNWKDSQQIQIQATGLAPSSDLEAALIALLVPGNYTAIVTGKGPATGVALLEFYDLP